MRQSYRVNFYVAVLKMTITFFRYWCSTCGKINRSIFILWSASRTI